MGFAPIAIVGWGCVLPGALSPEALWELVRGRRSALSPTPPDGWQLGAHADRHRLAEQTRGGVGGYVHGFEDVFDPEGFLLSSEVFRGLDPLFLWTLHAAREAMRSAGLDVRPGRRGGVLLGNLSYPTLSLGRLATEVWTDGRNGGVDPRNRFMSGYPAHLTARALGLEGRSFALDAACASSLYAIRLACDRLHEGSADVMLAGGVNHADDLILHLGFTALQAMSPTGRSRPFHREADGLVPAHGAALVALKRLSDAEASGDRVLGVIRAVGLSNDGRSRGLLTPSEDGQVRAMRAAYAMSGLGPEDISLVECHATGTSLGDAVEVRSMGAVFGEHARLPIGSLKSNLGHLITASGAAGLIKVLAAMHAGVRPPTLHAEAPLDALGDGPLRVLHEEEPWDSDGPRRAAINNFGFGGNNAHLLVEQWPPSPNEARAPTRAGVRSASDADPSEARAVAIVAQAVVAGSASSADVLAAALLDGRSLLSGNPPEAVAAPFVLDLEGVRMPPVDLREALPQQLLVLGAALSLRDAIARLPHERTGLFVGMQCDAEVARNAASWRASADPRHDVPKGFEPPTAATVLGCMPNIIANRLSHQLDLQGPSFTVSSEEASGTAALNLALGALARGELDAALVGAVNLSCEPVQRAAAEAVLAADRAAAGDAVVLLVLKRLTDARRDGDEIVAVLTSEGPPAPRLSLGLADGAFGLTPYVGHAHAASGLLHVAAAALAARHRFVPGPPGTPAMPWLPDEDGRIARVDVSALGAQRTRTFVRAEPSSASTRAPVTHVPRLAFFTAESMDALRSALAEGRQASGDGPLKLALVASDDAELARRAARAAALLARGGHHGSGLELDEGIYFGDHPAGGDLAFVFTGPAGAYPGMGRDVALALPDLVDALGDRCTSLRDVAGWVYEEAAPFAASPREKLWGSAFLCQLHARITREPSASRRMPPSATARARPTPCSPSAPGTGSTICATPSTARASSRASSTAPTTACAAPGTCQRTRRCAGVPSASSRPSIRCAPRWRTNREPTSR